MWWCAFLEWTTRIYFHKSVLSENLVVTSDNGVLEYTYTELLGNIKILRNPKGIRPVDYEHFKEIFII